MREFIREESIDLEDLCVYFYRCQKYCKDDTQCNIKTFYDKYPEFEILGVGARL